MREQLRFRCQDGFVSAPDDLTLEGWFNFSVNTGTRVLIGKAVEAADNNSYVCVQTTGSFEAGSATPRFTVLNYSWRLKLALVSSRPIRLTMRPTPDPLR